MNVFELREQLISDYSSYIRSFIRIRDERVDALVSSCLDQGRLWPDPLIQLNPSFQYAGRVDDLVAEGVLHSECTRIFRAGKDKREGKQLRLYQHQAAPSAKLRLKQRELAVERDLSGERRGRAVSDLLQFAELGPAQTVGVALVCCRGELCGIGRKIRERFLVRFERCLLCVMYAGAMKRVSGNNAAHRKRASRLLLTSPPALPGFRNRVLCVLGPQAHPDPMRRVPIRRFLGISRLLIGIGPEQRSPPSRNRDRLGPEYATASGAAWTTA